MNAPLSSRLTRLQRFGSIAVSGADARTFLQGQLSLDLDRLTPQRIEVAGCSSPQGRVQAVLWIVERSDAIVLVLPASMVDTTITRLRKYVLRAKVKIESGAGQFSVYDAGELPSADAPRTHAQREAMSFIRWPGASPRTLVLAPSGTSDATDLAREHAWHLDDIRAGLPQVYPQTHELFVAQMLNLDLLGGISFEKGCYTGQEIIARMHFRGSVKRRMFRFRASCAAPAPATRIVADGAHAGDVVDAVATPEGCELLAVIALAQIDAALELDGVSGGRLAKMEMEYEVK
jgi:folate-binding protein YgfZ